MDSQTTEYKQQQGKMPPLLPIRPARLPQDAERILEVFEAAKGIMVADGNTKQWSSDDVHLRR
jgi:hypothetical protein